VVRPVSRSWTKTLAASFEELEQAKAVAERLQPAQHKGRVRPRQRRSKDDERRCVTGEALIDATMTRLVLRRVAHAAPFSDGF
jgi:hypothetical protein